MAYRRASFGRLPQVQPNIESTLVSIANQMLAAEDSNIMDAWQSEGEWHGKKVTDDMVLEYWKKRMEGLDRGDPLYDQYKDKVMQLQYAVAQSKADLAHVQGKLSDSGYAQFFLNWAKKVPKNSEFWRTLQKDAAQLMQQARASASASAAKAKADAYNAFVNQRHGDIGLGNALTAAMDKMAKDAGLNLTDHGDEVLTMLTDAYSKNPGEFRALQDSLKGTSFDGTFTHKFVANAISNAGTAYKQVATRSKKDGYASQYASAAAGQSAMIGWGNNLKVWAPAQTYDQAYQAFGEIVDDPSASAPDKYQAAQTLAAHLTDIVKNNPALEPGVKLMLTNDITRLQGGQVDANQPSFGANMLGQTGVTDNMGTWIAQEKTKQDLMAANPGQYFYAPTDANGNFDPTGKGSVDIVSADSIPPDAVAVPVAGLSGTPHMVLVQPQQMVADDPLGGQPQVVGSIIQVGGMTLYQYKDADGHFQTTDTSPVADGASTYTDSKGVYHIAPAISVDPTATAAALDAKYPGLNLSDQLKANPGATGISAETNTYDGSGKRTAHVKVVWDGTKFVSSDTAYSLDSNGKEVAGATITSTENATNAGQLVGASLQPDAIAAGGVPGHTFSSWTAAAINAQTKMLSNDQVATLAQDPIMQHSFLQQTMKGLGIDDPLDPALKSAWNAATAMATESPGVIVPTVKSIGGGLAAARANQLQFPGAQEAKTKNETPSINFAGKTLTLPGLPAYMQDPMVTNRLKHGNVVDFLSVVSPARPATTKDVVTTVTDTSTGTTDTKPTTTKPTIYGPGAPVPPGTRGPNVPFGPTPTPRPKPPAPITTGKGGKALI